MRKQIGNAIAISEGIIQEGTLPLLEDAVDQLVDSLVRYLTEHHASMVDRPQISILRVPNQHDPFTQHINLAYRVTVDEP